MWEMIKKLFSGKSVNIAQLIKEGAVIIDVRSKGEYNKGHIKGSVNMPLDMLENSLTKLDKSKPIITCCASGIRSGNAARILLSHGFISVYNGGNWVDVDQYVN